MMKKMKIIKKKKVISKIRIFMLRKNKVKI